MSKISTEMKNGVKHEYKLVKLLKNHNLTAYRLPGTSSRSPDIIAGNGINVFIIEVKTSYDTRIRIPREQIAILKTTAINLRAKPVIAIKFIEKFIEKEDWQFISPESLKKHNKIFSIDYNTVMLKGIDIRELIFNEKQIKFI